LPLKALTLAIGMRWKQIIIVSLVAAVADFLFWLATVHLLFGAQIRASRLDVMILGLLLPLVFAAFAGIFVYRHTARRRKLQVFITSLLTLIFIVGIYVVGSRVFPRRVIIPSWTEPSVLTVS
jgi:hypothetical protein